MLSEDTRSIRIPLEQGLRQSTDRARNALWCGTRSIRIPLEQGLRQLNRLLCSRLQTCSIRIPLEQGLRQTRCIQLQTRSKFYPHSIRTRIKTFCSEISYTNKLAFYPHSIRTRIKTRRTPPYPLQVRGK